MDKNFDRMKVGEIVRPTLDARLVAVALCPPEISFLKIDFCFKKIRFSLSLSLSLSLFLSLSLSLSLSHTHTRLNCQQKNVSQYSDKIQV